MICERCGVDLETLPFGSWPFCKGRPEDHAPARTAVISDRLANPWIENLGHEPVYCETKQDLLREADARGLRLVDRWAGPSDKYLTNWAAGIDAQTLANATVLLSRGTPAVGDGPDPSRLETFQGSIRELKTRSDVEAAGVL